jgi:hypothetical protein
MSHVASVQCFVTDLQDMQAAAAACDLVLMVGQKSYKWFGTWMNDSNLAPGHDPNTFGQCEHALRLKDHRFNKDGTPIDYEIGLVPRIDGGPGWELLYDSWSGYGDRIHAKTGKDLVKLKDEIAAAAAYRELQRSGYRVQRSITPQGDIEIRGMR